MLAISHWYTSGTFYGATSLIAIIVFGALTVWATFRVGATRRQLTYSLAQSASLLAPLGGARQDIQVLYRGEQIAEPRVLWVHLTSRSRKDIRSTDFDRYRPLVLDVGIRIIALLGVGPDTGPLPPPEVKGSELRLGPNLIRRRERISIALLADGRFPHLTCMSPLVDVDVRSQSDYKRGAGWPAAALAALWGSLTLAVATLGAARSHGPVAVMYAAFAAVIVLFFASVLAGEIRMHVRRRRRQRRRRPES